MMHRDVPKPREMKLTFLDEPIMVIFPRPSERDETAWNNKHTSTSSNALIPVSMMSRTFKARNSSTKLVTSQKSVDSLN